MNSECSYSARITKTLKNNEKITEAEHVLILEIKTHPEKVQAYTALADLYIDQNNLSKAKALLNNAFKLEPDNPEIFSLTAKLFYKNSQISQAEQLAKKALLLSPEDSNAYLVLGKIYKDKTENNKFLDSKAISYFRKESIINFKLASKYNPSSPEIHTCLAKMYLAAGQDSNACEELLIAEELGFNNPDIIYFIGESYYKLGRYEKAIKFLKKPVIYNIAKYSQAHFILGNIYEKLADPDNASAEYKLALKYRPNNLQAKIRLDLLKENENIVSNLKNSSIVNKNTEKQSDEDSLTLADYYLVTDKLAQARELYLQALQKFPENERARKGLCELYYSQWALGYFNPDNFYVDAGYLENNNDSDKLLIPAIKAKIISSTDMSGPIRDKLKEISGNSDQDPYSLLNASRAAFLIGNYKVSKKILNTLVTPNLSDYQKFNAAKDLYLDHNYYECKILLKSLQGKYPDDIIGSILAQINEKLGLTDDLISQGKKLYRKKLYQDAVNKYKQAILIIPTCKTAHVFYAYALDKLGNTDEAIKQLKIYASLEELYPSSKPEMTSKQVDNLLKSWGET